MKNLDGTLKERRRKKQILKLEWVNKTLVPIGG